MTPPSRRGTRRAADFDLLTARRRRSRRRSRVDRRKRVGVLLGVFAVMIGIGFVTVGFGGAVAYSQGCSLSSLREIAIGENTFIYAADGSLLGVIPAEKNRQPVNFSQIDPWLPLATVSIEDKRFWSHGGVDPEGMARALWADVRAGKAGAGRLHDHAAARAQPLQRQRFEREDRAAEAEGSVSRDQAEQPVVEDSGS